MSQQTFSIVYLTISSIIMAVDAGLAYLAFRKRDKSGRELGMIMLISLLAMLSYFGSVFSKTYFNFSLHSAIYFISIDLLLIYLWAFCLSFTGLQLNTGHKRAVHVLLVLSVIDIVIQGINPFFEIAIGYKETAGHLVRFVYDMHFLYHCHLFLSYIYVVLVFVAFSVKLYRTPGVYKRLYVTPMLAIVLVVAINAIFLTLPSMELDLALWGYPVVAFIMYWNLYHYKEHGFIDNFKSDMLENLGQGLALFDYENNMILHNERLEKMLPEFEFNDGMNLNDFAERVGIPIADPYSGDRRSVQFYSAAQHAIRCDINLIRSRKHQITSQLYIFTDVHRDTDVLTGFNNWDSFTELIRDNPDAFSRPIAVCVCDINGLSLINKLQGRNVGDQKIQELAKVMKEVFPRETYFVRGQEATLIALGYKMYEREALQYLVRVASKCSAKIQYAVSYLSIKDEELIEKVTQASHALAAKKMLDQNSSHSATMNSLIRALQECDSDTEEHVRRTREAGAKLGARLGLSDVQQSDLALLCLLHDIGKIGIPLEILNKPGKLTNDEWRVLQTHVEKGWQIAHSSPELSGIADMIRHHHERWDGKGYPDGLSRESIPLLSRIISIVDAYDAMINNRSYRNAQSVEYARNELRLGAGSQFDPNIANEYLKMLEEEDLERAEKGESSETKDEGKKEPTRLDKAVGTNVIAGTNSMSMPASENADDTFVHLVKYSRYLLNAAQEIVTVDETFTELTGYTEEDVKNGHMTQMDLIFPEDRTEYLCRVSEQLGRYQTAYFEHRIKKKDGNTLYVCCFGKVFYDSANQEERSEIIISDSTRTYAMKLVAAEERSRAEKRLQRWETLYRLDSLTGLLNHEAYMNDVETRLLEKKYTVMMLMIDLDRFKQYNDTFGHHAGDQFLIQVAQTLISTLREKDLACRMGGDEFSVSLFFDQGCSEELMNRRASEIFDKVSLMLTAERGDCGVSMGMALSNDKLNTFNSLYEAADKALYYSKEHGKGRLTGFQE